MRLCIDIQAALAQRAGVGRYTKALVEHLPASAGQDELSLFYFDFKRHGTPFSVPGAHTQAIRWLPGRFVQQAWKTLQWPPFDFFAGPADVYHFPNFIIPPLRKGQAVVTIHDMSFMRHPEFAEARNQRYLSAAIRPTARRAAAIITDSQFSADEIVECLGVEPTRVHPIHLGISGEWTSPAPETIADMRRRLQLDRPYVLTVGTLEPRKNIPLLIDLLEQWREFDGLLVIAGMPGWKCEPILERMRTSACADRIRFLSYVPETDLSSLYAGAELFLFPSFYEGFGFPPLEAMACGTPVVSSRGGSLAEVLGEAACLPDSLSLESWLEAVRRLTTDSAVRETLRQRGRQHAARFTWDATARKTWSVYRGVAS